MLDLVLPPCFYSIRRVKRFVTAQWGPTYWATTIWEVLVRLSVFLP